MTHNFDIVICGAGPAGALTAILLARQGYRVAVISAPRGRGRIEGFSQRTVDILHAHGLRHAHQAIGPLVARIASWAGDHGARNQEYVTDRHNFDAALLNDLAAHDVTVSHTRHVIVSLADDAVVVRAHIDDSAHDYHAKFFVEARGRAAPAGRAKVLRGPTTTAIVRQIDATDIAAQTAVASFADGWAWFVADGAGPAYLQIFVDSQAGLPKRERLTAFFDAHVDRINESAAWLRDGRLTGPVAAHNASPQMAAAPLDRCVIRVGDAACAPDPLSGNGMFAALGSALAASPVIRTLIELPGNRALAESFYRERTQDIFRRYGRTGRDFYRLETRWPHRPFWKARRDWPDDQAAHELPLSAPVVLASRPVVDQGLIVEREVCITPDFPRGIWQVDRVPVPPLIQMLASRRGGSLDDVLADMSARFGATPAQLATALDWLRYRRVLICDDPIELRTMPGIDP